jgi:hypothetical protein
MLPESIANSTNWSSLQNGDALCTFQKVTASTVSGFGQKKHSAASNS